MEYASAYRSNLIYILYKYVSKKKDTGSKDPYASAYRKIYFEFIDFTGLYYVMFAHNSVVLRN